MPCTGDLHCHSVRDAFGEGMVVARRNGLVAGAPCDQQWDVAEQAQLTHGTDRLSAPVDDRAGSPKKRPPLLLVRQSAQDVREHLSVRASYQRGDHTKERPGDTGRNRAESGDDSVCTGQRGRAEDGCDFGAEAATADQHDAIGAFRKLVGGL